MKCRDGEQCIKDYQMCDGFRQDCEDGSDEDPGVCQEWKCVEGRRGRRASSSVTHQHSVIITSSVITGQSVGVNMMLSGSF